MPRPDEPGEAADNMFELVTRALNVAYYEWVPGRDALRFSPALFALFGYEPGAWTPQRSLESIHQDDRAAHRAARIAYLKSAADRAEFTYRARMANGEWRWLCDQTTVERDGSGRVTRPRRPLCRAADTEPRPDRAPGRQHRGAANDLRLAQQSAAGVRTDRAPGLRAVPRGARLRHRV